jgi:chromosome segregation ATPase
MKNNQFRGPLLQSAALLAGTIILATIAASAGNGSSGGGILTIVAGIGKSILFIIGLAIGLGFSIAVLIGIFLAAVAMVSPEQASLMYSDLKKNFSQSVVTFRNSRSCCEKDKSDTQINFEESNRMKQELIDLQNTNLGLTGKIEELEKDSVLFKGKVDNLQTDNSALKTRIEELSLAVNNLSNSENAIRDLVADLTVKIKSASDPDMLAQINNLERLQSQTRKEIELLIERLNVLESSTKQSSTSGIFSYIGSEEAQALFIKKVEEALKQEMTYAQIDDYLSSILPPDLDKIIKDHPALTKNYIRSLRRD